MKNLKKLIITVLIICVCVVVVYVICCNPVSHKQDINDTEISSIAAESTSDTTQSTTENISATTIETTADNSTTTTKETTTKKKPTTTKKKTSDYDTSISLNEALNVLDDFYGSAYNVNATVVEDGWQYFAVYDNRGTKYASVKVNLSTADAVETIIATQEVNEYNLLV